MKGAPLRFAAVVIGGWTVGRVLMVFPPAGSPLPAQSPSLATSAQARSRATAVSAHLVEPAASAQETIGAAPAPEARRPGSVSPKPAHVANPGPKTKVSAAPSLASAEPIDRPDDPVPRASPRVAERRSTLRPVIVSHSRLAADAWLVLRPRGGANLAFGQLGASQGGARLTYALDESRHVALSARVSAPTRGPGAEAGFGVDVRPTPLPIHLLVEERIGIGGGARAAAGVIAGASSALPARLRLDAYGQAGAVAGRGGFADGAALVARSVLERGRARVELGGGAWGAAQRGASRLDVGPSLALVAPLGGKAVRLQLDYRARVAGRARPGSGPALTLGGSF